METLVELVARITADATELKKTLGESEKGMEGLGKTAGKETKSISQSFKEMGKALTIVGVAITAAMTGAIMSFTKVGSELHDLALKTGVSVQALAGLKYAAEQNGASLGTIEMAIRRTASALIDAKDGLAETVRAFDRMGISVKDLEGLSVEDQFLMIANAIAAIPDPMTRAATAVDLFGRSGTDMLPMLAEGADGLRKMMEEGVRLTGWTDEGAKSADALGDAFGTLKTSTMGVFNAIGSSLAPTLTDLINKISGVVSNFKDWINEHPVLSKAILTITGIIGGLALALGGLLLLGSQLIIAYGTMSAFIITTLIPTIVAAIAAAWAWAAAQLAAIAASGFGIPIAIAAAAAIGILTTGIVLLAKNQREQINTTENATDAQKILNDTIKQGQNVVDQYKESTQGMKQAIGYATYMVDGYTYSMSLFTQAEIDAAKASGKKVEVLKTQSDVTQDNIDKTKDYIKTIGDASVVVDTLSGGITDYVTALQNAANIKMGLGAITAAGGKLTEEQILEYQRAARAAKYPLMEAYPGLTPNQAAAIAHGQAELVGGIAISTLAGTLGQAVPATYAGMQHGGIVTQPTLGLIGEAGPEAVIPLNEAMGGITINFTQPVFFDREDTMNRFVDMIRKGIQRQDRLRFGGAYSG